MISALTIWIDNSPSGNSASTVKIVKTKCCMIPASPARATVMAAKHAVSVVMPPRYTQVACLRTER